jgi:DNA polymerase III sliding clamp (beta) subunit (PCNA family)
LNGVLVEVRASETRIAATDSHCAAVLRDEVLVGEQPVFPDVIIPNATLKLALQTKAQMVELSVSDSGKWSLGGIAFAPVEGRFPDYRRIMVNGASGVAGDYNIDLLGKFVKAAKALGSRGQPVVRQNGTDAAQVQILGREDEFVGVIMPMRMFNEKTPDPGISTWGGNL